MSILTHDQGEAMALSDRIVVMNKGRVEQIAAPHAAYARPATAFVANFLGKTNVLAAHGDGATLRIGECRWPLVEQAHGLQQATVRPERIAFAADTTASLAGTVRTRIFQGNHWLYQIDTSAGPVTVIRQNNGAAAPVEGETVQLSWGIADMTLRPAGAVPS